jgi:hypothetical protein
MTTAMASFPLFSYAVTKMKVTERFNLSEKDLILLFSASALAEFFVLKRAGYRIIKKSEEKYEKETLKPNNNNGSLYSDMLKTRDEKNKAHENNYSK